MRRMLAIILAVLMFTGVLPSVLADGDNAVKVTKISVSGADTVPSAGRTAGSMHMGHVTVNDNLSVAAFGHSYWWDCTNEWAFYDDEIFEEGNSYQHVWTVRLDDGYVFADDFEIELNGRTDNIEMFGMEGDAQMYFWSMPETAQTDLLLHCIQIENADITPVIGRKAGELKEADITADGTDRFTVRNDSWNRMADGGEEPVDDDYVFEADCAYFRSFVIEPSDNLSFAEDTWVTINGMDVPCRVFADGTLHTQANAFPSVDHLDIDTVDVYLYGAYNTPLGGDTVVDYLEYETPGHVKYSVSSASWYDVGAAAFIENTDTFVTGRDYALRIRFTADDMYAFTEDARAYINDDDLTVDTEKSGTDEADSSIFDLWTVTFTCKKRPEYVPEINVTGVDYPPVAGDAVSEHMKYTLPEDAHYTVEEMYWYDDITRMKMKDGDVYTPGHSYSVGFVVVADEDCVFSSNTVFTLNGESSLLDSDWTFFDEWDPDHYYACSVSHMLPEENTQDISAVDVSGFVTQPVVGRTAAEFSGFTVADDAHYSVYRVTWYSDFGDDLSDDDVFEAGTVYLAEIAIVADVGYSFGDTLTLTLNGGDDFDAEYSGYVNNKVARIVTYGVEAAAADLSTGDLNGDGTVNTADAVVVLKSSAGMVTLYDSQLNAGDTNHDGKVNTADAVLILKYAAGMIAEF